MSEEPNPLPLLPENNLSLRCWLGWHDWYYSLPRDDAGYKKCTRCKKVKFL